MEKWWRWLLTCISWFPLLLEFNRLSKKLQEQIYSQERHRFASEMKALKSAKGRFRKPISGLWYAFSKSLSPLAS